MTDTSGAVLLVGHEMSTTPVSHPEPVAGTWNEWSKDSGFQPSSVRAATHWLMAASILQALMLHVRRDRGSAFGLDTRDPNSLTIAQLAALLRPHNGSAGQAFEFAVADSINFERPRAVQERIREAVAAIGVSMQRPGAVVIGLEKVADPSAFTEALHPLLSDHHLRTAGPGRPANAMNAIKNYLRDGGGVDYRRGELAAADLLVYDRGGHNAITASVKIGYARWNRRWDNMAHPRLLLTTDMDVRRFTKHLPPGTAAVGIADASWMADFQHTFNHLLGHLEDIDLGRTPRAPSGPVHARYWHGPAFGKLIMRSRTVDEVVADLQDRAHTLAGAFDLQLRQRNPSTTKMQQDLLLSDDTTATVQGLEKQALVTPAHQFYTRRESGLIVPTSAI